MEKLYRELDTDELLTEREIIERFSSKLAEHSNNRKLLRDETVRKLISLSKKIGSNGLGQ